MYDNIAKVHGQIREAKFRAKTAGVKIQLQPALLVHLEESVAFLAEELLGLRSIVESMLPPKAAASPAQLEETKKMLQEQDGTLT